MPTRSVMKFVDGNTTVSGGGNPSQAIYDTMHWSNMDYRQNNQGLDLWSHWKHALSTFTSVLEVGCGNGKLCEYMANFCHDVTGIDMVEGPYDRKGYQFYQRDIVNDPMHVEYDLTVCFDVMEHLDIKDVNTVLKKIGGTSDHLIMSIACYGSPPLHLTVRTPGWWLDTLMEQLPLFHWKVLFIDFRHAKYYSPVVLFEGTKL